MGLRAKKSDKRRKTFEKYGKNSKKALRIMIAQSANAEENLKNKSQQQINIAQQNKNKKQNKKKKNRR